MRLSDGRPQNPLSKLLGGSLDLLFPLRCAACSRSLDHTSRAMLCPECFDAVRPLASPLCPCCGTGRSADGGTEDRFCAACLRHPPPFDRARSLFAYAPPLSLLLQRLKFQGDSVAATALGRLGRLLLDSGSPPERDVIVPVPLHPSRLKKRGLNQSLVLARELFPRETEKLAPRILVRTRNTPAQTGLSGKERRRNLHGAFIIRDARPVMDKRVLLVDDVYTTGTTVLECSRILKRAGAAEVEVLTMARAELARS